MAREYYGGPVVLGEAANLPFITDPNTGVATAPTGTPQYSIYTADLTTTLIAATNATQLAALTGTYYIPESISSGSGFAAGSNYVALITYVISGTTYTKLCRFTAA